MTPGATNEGALRRAFVVFCSPGLRKRHASLLVGLSFIVRPSQGDKASTSRLFVPTPFEKIYVGSREKIAKRTL
jgi:hypothetical protein